MNTSHMHKDLMNPDLWWSLNRASCSRYSNELRSIQATIWIHPSTGLTWTIQHPARVFYLCPSPPRSHSPHYSHRIFFFFFFLSFIFISWRLITLQYCSCFCNTLTRVSHGFTCVPHPDSPHLPPHPIPLGHLSAPALSTCLIHPTWTGDLFHTW